MRRTLRLGRLAVLLVAVALLAIGVHFLHGFQVARNADVLLARAAEARTHAEEAKKAGDAPAAAASLAQAADYLKRYLGFHPDDADAVAKLGFVLEEQAKTPLQKQRAFLVLEKAVRLDPGRDDIRRRLAELAVSIGRTLDAREHLNRLLNGPFPHDPGLEYLLGRCEEADAHFPQARAAYEKAIKDGPQRVETYVRLASLLRRRGDLAVQDADGKDDSTADGVTHYTKPEDVLKDMVTACPNSSAALLARSRYLRDVGLFPDAIRDVEAASKIAPEEVEVLLASADLKMETGDLEGARRDLEKGLTSHPQEMRLLLEMAAVEMRQAHPSQALDRLQAARDLLGVQPASGDDVWNLATLFIDAGKPDEARDLLEKLNATGPSPGADFLQARLDFGDGKFASAAALLEDRRQDLGASPELARQADRLLGLCYQKLEDPEQQLAAFRRAAEEDPSWLPGRLGQASALLAAGKFDDALAEYRQLAARAPEARLATVRLLIVRNLRAPADQRNWAEADALLDEAGADVRKTTDFRLTKVNLLAAEGRFEDAWKGLNDAIADEPKEMRYRLVQADLADFGKGRRDWKPPQTSQAILDRAETEVGDTTDLRLARAARFAALPHEEAVKGLGTLEDNTDAFDAADQIRLFAGLTEAYVRIGDLERAVLVCRRARDRSKDDLGVRLRLFDLSVQSFGRRLKAGGKEGLNRDVETLQGMVDDVRGVEGADGVWWRTCEVSLLLFQAAQGDKAGLKDAHGLLAEVVKRRPGWSRPLLLEGELDELEGDVDSAVAKYQQAIDLGERRPAVIRQTVQLLASRRRYDEAREALRKLDSGDDLGRLAAQVSLLSRDPKERTLELLKPAAEAAKDSKDYRDSLWLGQLYEAMEEHASAEAAFRRAIQLDPSAQEPRAALVLLLAGTGEKDKAAAELAEAGKVLPPDKAGMVLAVGNEALGRRDKAEEQFLALLKAKPDVANLRAAVAFYLRGGDVAKATPLLHQIIDAPGQTDAEPVLWARRTLALALAASGDYKQSKDALDLLDQNLQERNAPEDQRVRAIVLALRPGGRKESIQTLEESFTRLRPTPNEEFLLARLYEADRDWDHANEHFLALVSAKGGANAMVLAYYIQALLRRQEGKEAAAWLQRLETLEPNSARTVGVKARVLSAQGQGEAAARLVEDFAEKTFKEKKNAAVLGDAASLLEELGRPIEAEKKYREYVKAVEVEQPERTLVLAAFLARQDRLTEALDVIEGVWAKCKPETAAATVVAALRVGRPTPQHLRRVERMLQDAIAANPTATNLLVSLADLRDAEAQDAEAEKLYRQVLTRNPRNPLALNNLAWLLAFQPAKAAEALELTDRRLAITGPNPSVLDTRGMVLLKLGRADEAAQSFSDAAAQNPTAVFYFHLAEAKRAAGQPNEAEKAWLKAKELGFRKTDLHPLEREHPDYDEKWFAEGETK